jgi:hypothetical protein
MIGQLRLQSPFQETFGELFEQPGLPDQIFWVGIFEVGKQAVQ